MPFRSLRSRSLADRVFDRLAAELISERYAQGEALPSERDLVEAFGVARHVIREAIKRLEQIGLVRTTPGGATRALEFRRSAGLDLLSVLVEHARGDEIASYAVSVLEMRAAIGADIVRMCAQRASSSLRGALMEAAQAMSQAANQDDELYAHELRFWDLLLEGAENIAYRLAVNSLLNGTEMIGSAARSLFLMEIRETGFRVPIARAIVSGAPREAEKVAREALMRSVQLAEVARAGTSKASSGRRPTTPSV